MTDPELVEKKLAGIETFVHQLRTLADPDRLRSDVKEKRFVTHTLQLAALELGIVERVLAERLGDLLDFAAAVGARLEPEGKG